jgi:mutual gliding-motility protein MglA
MASLNQERRELTLKVVYYGPALGGKTTNLRALRGLAADGSVGRLMNLETHDDRSLFLNLLPVRLFTENGIVIKLKLLTVPGQPIHKSTRRIILRGADAVIFVADSRKEATEDNKASFRDLRENLEEMGGSKNTPLVLQFNKQDLPFVRTPQELAAFGARVSSPVVAAVAIDGIGVVESLKVVLGLAWQRLEDEFAVSSSIGLDRDVLESSLFPGWHAPSQGVGSLS